ncbi:hypothetical protein JR316_0010087 [Psilocybe cubensis]|uniref:Uncharacterized protein n=1 Tax=Psilocybe cubensis TaxID=181762 RepID=A0ACB8GQV2_PSICU|nr:hypothetical protein JR316_0010087 [Psilocybe cubensis]KAH9477855.1 hypothetical protein JR316_0010087 [Psilocybe cubensis]
MLIDINSLCLNLSVSLLLHTDRDKAPHLPSPISTDSRRAFTFCTLLAIIFNLIVDTHRHKTHQNGCRFIVHNLYISAHNRDPPRYLTPTAIRHSSYDTRNTWQHCAKHLQGASLHSAYQTLGLSTTNHESDKKLTEILNVRYRPGQQRTTHIDSSVSRLKLAVSMAPVSSSPSLAHGTPQPVFAPPHSRSSTLTSLTAGSQEVLTHQPSSSLFQSFVTIFSKRPRWKHGVTMITIAGRHSEVDSWQAQGRENPAGVVLNLDRLRYLERCLPTIQFSVRQHEFTKNKLTGPRARLFNIHRDRGTYLQSQQPTAHLVSHTAPTAPALRLHSSLLHHTIPLAFIDFQRDSDEEHDCSSTSRDRPDNACKEQHQTSMSVSKTARSDLDMQGAYSDASPTSPNTRRHRQARISSCLSSCQHKPYQKHDDRDTYGGGRTFKRGLDEEEWVRCVAVKGACVICDCSAPILSLLYSNATVIRTRHPARQRGATNTYDGVSRTSSSSCLNTSLQHPDKEHDDKTLTGEAVRLDVVITSARMGVNQQKDIPARKTHTEKARHEQGGLQIGECELDFCDRQQSRLVVVPVQREEWGARCPRLEERRGERSGEAKAG